VSTRRARPPAIDAAAGVRAARLLGWPGVVLAPMTVFGVRVLPVVVLDANAHRARHTCGDGPQLDGDTLAVWEWPESGAHAPPSVVAVSGLLIPNADPTGQGRAALGRARRVRGFRPAAVFTAHGAVDEVCRLEHAFHGIGLVTTTDADDVVAAAPGRAPRARRRTADRWVEELLYATAIDAGHLPAGDNTP
jgi:hypothetical protein